MNLSWKEGWGCRVRYGIWAGVALMHWDADEVMVEICCGGIRGESVRASTASQIKINGCGFFEDEWIVNR